MRLISLVAQEASIALRAPASLMGAARALDTHEVQLKQLRLRALPAPKPASAVSQSFFGPWEGAPSGE
jgi:hypothetical protein